MPVWGLSGCGPLGLRCLDQDTGYQQLALDPPPPPCPPTQDMGYRQLARWQTLSTFTDDVRTNLATTFGLARSQVQVTGIQPADSTTITALLSSSFSLQPASAVAFSSPSWPLVGFVVTASSPSGLHVLNSTLVDLVNAANPLAAAFTTAFATAYGIQAALFTRVRA